MAARSGLGAYVFNREITSPGAFPRGITLDEVLDGRSEVRNKVIARVFKEAELIEQWGRGIQKLTRLCLEAGLQKPDIVETGMFVQVTFYRKSRTQKSDAIVGRKSRTQKPDANRKTVEAQNNIVAFVFKCSDLFYFFGRTSTS